MIKVKKNPDNNQENAMSNENIVGCLAAVISHSLTFRLSLNILPIPSTLIRRIILFVGRLMLIDNPNKSILLVGKTSEQWNKKIFLDEFKNRFSSIMLSPNLFKQLWVSIVRSFVR